MSRQQAEATTSDENDFGEQTDGDQAADGKKGPSPFTVMQRIERAIDGLTEADRRGVLAWLDARYKISARIPY